MASRIYSIAARVAGDSGEWYKDHSKVWDFAKVLVDDGTLDSAQAVLEYFYQPSDWNSEYEIHKSGTRMANDFGVWGGASEDEFNAALEGMERRRKKDLDTYQDSLKDLAAMANGAKIDARQDYYEGWTDDDFKRLLKELGESADLKDYKYGTEDDEGADYPHHGV